VVLPSLLASLVPWAAAGPSNRTLLDRFDSITHLPVLTPLYVRQVPTPPRSGTLLIAPGDHPRETPTHFHELAFDSPGASEQLVSGVDATTRRVTQASQHSDVVALFAHGQLELGSGCVQLADGKLTRFDLDRNWRGCERVELWACRTGVNVPLDELSPFVDEAFGLDVEFHHMGVRSTIGTLWPVHDLATALIVQAYRRQLAEGAAAPRALAAAQRWWRDRAVPSLERKLRHLPPEQAVRELVGAAGPVGYTQEPSEHLGPLQEDQPASEGAREALLESIASPLTWAGFRFVGVCERRPTGEWSPAWDEPPTTEELAEVDRLLDGG